MNTARCLWWADGYEGFVVALLHFQHEPLKDFYYTEVVCLFTCHANAEM